MDTRTAQILRALDPLTVDLLLELVQRPSAEKALVQAVEHGTQPTIHNKLRRLGEIGLIKRRSDASTRGRPWTVTQPEKTLDLLNALLALADAVEAADRTERAQIREKLARPQQDGPALRLVRGRGERR
jgi:DNA-binding MarR family transcriptional regulator